MTSTQEFNSYQLTRDLFYTRLINQAGLAYKAWYTKLIGEEQYASEDSELRYAEIHQIRVTARNALKNYIMDFLELHDLYLQSDETTHNIKRHAKSFFKSYTGEPGDQQQFAEYFARRVHVLINQTPISLRDIEYAPDSSDDEEHLAENKPQEVSVLLSKMKPSSMGLISAFLADFVSESIVTQPIIQPPNEPSDYFLMDDALEIEDEEALDSLICAFALPIESSALTTQSMGLESESELRPLVDPALQPHESLCFSQRSASGKRVTFFGPGFPECIQLERKAALEDSMVAFMV